MKSPLSIKQCIFLPLQPCYSLSYRVINFICEAYSPPPPMNFIHAYKFPSISLKTFFGETLYYYVEQEMPRNGVRETVAKKNIKLNSFCVDDVGSL